MFIIDLHAKEEKLIPQPSYTGVFFLLLAHAYTPILAAIHLMPVGRGTDKAYIKYLECSQKEKMPYSPKGRHELNIFAVGQQV